jgi:hypothetical protein
MPLCRGGRPPRHPGRKAPGAKANFHVPDWIKGGMPETVRVSRHPWLAVFGRAWKPDLLIKVGDCFPGAMLSQRGERPGTACPSVAEASHPGAPAGKRRERKPTFPLPAGSKGGMPETARVSRHSWPAVFGRAYPYRGTLEARPAKGGGRLLLQRSASPPRKRKPTSMPPAGSPGACPRRCDYGGIPGRSCSLQAPARKAPSGPPNGFTLFTDAVQ